MKHRQLHRALYQLQHRYLTLNNIVIGVAFLIAAGWIWGSLGVMQRNYTLQQTVDRKNQELRLAGLETRSLELEREYYKTREYQELAVRRQLGKGTSGEKVLLLAPRPLPPAPTPANPKRVAPPQEELSNFDQWMQFLFSRGDTTSADHSR